MNCPQWEERIAALEKDVEVERHLKQCVACRDFVREVERSLEVLKDAHLEEIAPAHFAAVRARVFARIDQTRRHWIWRLAFAAATLFAILYPALMREREVVPPPPVRPAAAPAPAPYVARHVEKKRVVRRRVERPQTEPLVVKMLTDDPNVVIYWITDQRGE